MDIESEARDLLVNGYHFNEIAKITGLSIPQIRRRRKRYNINMQEAFKNRLNTFGIPNRSPKDDAFCAWFVGFFDGEGTFQFWYRKKPKDQQQFAMYLSIGLRDDDKSVFDYIVSKVGGTYIPYVPKQGTSNPSVTWHTERIEDLQEIFIPIFDRFPPRSKKYGQYQIWKQFITEKYINTLGGNTTFKYEFGFSERFFNAMEQVKRLRNYEHTGSLDHINSSVLIL